MSSFALPWLCLKVLLGKCSKHPSCMRQGQRSVLTCTCPSQRYDLTFAQYHDDHMAAWLLGSLAISEAQGASWPWNLNVISRPSWHPCKAKSSCSVVLCTRIVDLTASSQRRCHVGSCLQIKRRDDQMVFAIMMA